MNDGTCVLKNLNVNAYGQSDGKRTAYRSFGAIISMSPDDDILSGKSLDEIRKIRQHLVIMENTTISCMPGSMPAVYSQCLSSASYNYREISAYIHRPRLDVHGTILGKGLEPNDIILLAEYGNDKMVEQGSDTFIYDTAVISCDYGIPIAHINSGRLTLYGGKVDGTSGILVRYRNALSVPEDSTVEVHAHGNTGLTYLPSSIHHTNWDNGYTEESYSNSNHAWGLGHALMIDRQPYSFNYTNPEVKVDGGKWVSDHNYAIASYPY